MNPLTLNRYDYTSNNPVMYTDPSGHRIMAEDGGGTTAYASSSAKVINQKPDNMDAVMVQYSKTVARTQPLGKKTPTEIYDKVEKALELGKYAKQGCGDLPYLKQDTSYTTNKNYTWNEADKYINDRIYGFVIGTKKYNANEISNLPGQISYSKDGYRYTYILGEYHYYFNGIELSNSDPSLEKLGINLNTYEYKLAYTNQPPMYTGTIFVTPSLTGIAEGAGNAADFEKKISKMSPNDRVAAVKTEINRIVNENGLIKDNKLTKINNRDVYRNPDTGELFAVDTQHGRFESLNPKNGKHLGEVDFDFNPIPNSIDKSGGHDLKMK